MKFYPLVKIFKVEPLYPTDKSHKLNAQSKPTNTTELTHRTQCDGTYINFKNTQN